MPQIKFYCVTNKKVDFLKSDLFNFCWVGDGQPPKNYFTCNDKDNIFDREKFYSELTFHYWYWKNILPNETKKWVGFCQKRRFWIKSDTNEETISIKNLNKFLLNEISNELKSYDSFICSPISVSGANKIKIIKRGWKNLIKDPTIILKPNKETISLHFDMHHGYKNLEKAIDLLDDENKNDFREYVNSRNFYNPHIMCIARPDILNKWFNNLFPWLKRCEEEFGFKNLKGYDTQRLYAYLAERYLSYWFKKYTKFKELPWTLIEI